MVVEDDVAIGRNLASLRSARGLSQGELADQIGVAQQTIAKIEKGSRPLRFVEANLICAILKVPIASLAARDVTASAALLALSTQVWEVSRAIVEPAPRLAHALVQLAHEVAAIRSGIRPQAAQFEYDRAVGFLHADWGKDLNEALTRAVRADDLVSDLAEVHGHTYRELLATLSALEVTQTSGPDS